MPNLKSTTSPNRFIKIYNETFKEAKPVCASCVDHCCKGCGPASGYLYGDKPNRDISELKEKYGFSKEKGFLGETGCKLPPSDRSETCVLFTCHKIASLVEPQARDLLSIINTRFNPGVYYIINP